VSDTLLSQVEADDLLSMPKVAADKKERDYPPEGGALTVPLISQDGREEFLLDVRRGRINVAKVTYQNRARHVVVLARLDVAGPPHTNPDGEELPCPHLHVYREGYGDSCAVPVSEDEFRDTADAWGTLQDFMRYCNVVQFPAIRRGLFP
jgi:hypothetical protein